MPFVWTRATANVRLGVSIFAFRPLEFLAGFVNPEYVLWSLRVRFRLLLPLPFANIFIRRHQSPTVALVDSSTQTDDVNASTSPSTVDASCQTDSVAPQIHSSTQTEDLTTSTPRFTVDSSCQTEPCTDSPSSTQTDPLTTVDSSCQTDSVAPYSDSLTETEELRASTSCSTVDSTCQTEARTTVASSTQTDPLTTVDSSCQTDSVAPCPDSSTQIEEPRASTSCAPLDLSCQTEARTTVISSTQTDPPNTVDSSCQTDRVTPQLDSPAQTEDCVTSTPLSSVDSSCQTEARITVTSATQTEDSPNFTPRSSLDSSCQTEACAIVSSNQTDPLNTVDSSCHTDRVASQLDLSTQTEDLPTFTRRSTVDSSCETEACPTSTSSTQTNSLVVLNSASKFASAGQTDLSNTRDLPPQAGDLPAPTLSPITLDFSTQSENPSVATSSKPDFSCQTEFPTTPNSSVQSQSRITKIPRIVIVPPCETQPLVDVDSYTQTCHLTVANPQTTLEPSRQRNPLHSLTMDAKVSADLALLRSHATSVEKKVNIVLELKASIKHNVVSEGAVSNIFDVLRLALAAPHGSLVAAGFTTLTHFLKRMTIQDQKQIGIHGLRLLPVIMERFGDSKDKHRESAVYAIVDLWVALPMEVERLIRDNGMTSKNPRTKESSMHWLAKTSRERGLQFRAFVPSLVDALEDADGMVRDVAKTTIVDLFKTAPPHAKADLRRQLEERNVRKTIASDVIQRLDLPSAADLDARPVTASKQLSRQPSSAKDDAKRRPEPARPGSSKSTSSSSSRAAPPAATSKPIAQQTQALASEPENPKGVEKPKPAGLKAEKKAPGEPEILGVGAMYINTPRELDDLFREMHPCFEGKESEANWMARERNVIKLRSLTQGNSPSDFQAPFVAGMRSLLDGILKVVNSLRTTVSTNGCCLVQEMARRLGPGLEPMVEILLQNLIRLCAGTKKISSQRGNETVNAIFENVSYSSRLMQHIWGACQDKNVQPRTYATSWLRTIIERHGHHKAQLEHAGAPEHFERCIKKGLADANPGVREGMRGTFWVFARVWPERAEIIEAGLDANSRRLLQEDPGNPCLPPKAEAGAGKSTKATFSRGLVQSHPSRSSLKDTIAAQRREAAAAAAARNQVVKRPGSAQSAFSSSTQPVSRPTVQPTSSTPAVLPGISSAPMRPMRAPRRPETARPTTSDSQGSRKMKENVDAVPSGATSGETKDGGSLQNKQSRDVTKGNAAPAMSVEMSPSQAYGDLTMVMPSVRPRPNSRDGHNTKENRPARVVPAFSERAPDDQTSGGADFGAQKPSESPATLLLATPSPKSSAQAPALREPSPPENVATRSAAEDVAKYSGADVPPSVERSLSEPATDRLAEDPFRELPAASEQVHDELMVDDAHTNEEEADGRAALKVYEDPEHKAAAADDDFSGPKAPPTVLEELTVNEPVQPAVTASAAASAGDAAIQKPTWEKKAATAHPSKETQQRRLLESGIKSGFAGKLDVHGYRKLQQVLRSGQDLWTEAHVFDQCVRSLLEALPREDPADGSTAIKARDIKVQVVRTLRVLQQEEAVRFQPYIPRVIKALLAARCCHQTTLHVATDIENLAMDLNKLGDADTNLPALLEFLESADATLDASPVRMAFNMTADIILRPSFADSLAEEVTDRLGHVCVEMLDGNDTSRRRATVEFCKKLQGVIARESKFWTILESCRDDSRNILRYYLARGN